MKAYLFPGQGSQFTGMGKELFQKSSLAREMFVTANQMLDFSITDLMFSGEEVDLCQTKVCQPAIFLHSVILAAVLDDRVALEPEMVAGHSLGEFSALVVAQALSFEDGLQLVIARAKAMQKACKVQPSAMSAVLGLEAEVVEEVLASINETVVLASYNKPQQIVISGSIAGIETASQKLKTAGAKRIIRLQVGGAFHSPLMESAITELTKAVNQAVFKQPICPIYQNVSALAVTDPVLIRKNLIAQLTAPVYWHQTILKMIADGANSFFEIGPGQVLYGFVRNIAPIIVMS